jgi:prepilin-type N-terminal cleavage/methylation domain-containing protein
MIQNKKRGFSLIEILIVIAILALIGSLVYPVVQGNRDKSAYEVSVTNLSSVAKAMEHYYLEKGKYPALKDWSELTTDASPLAEYITTVPTEDASHRKYKVKESTETGYVFEGLGLPGKMNRDYPDYSFSTGAKMKKGKKAAS